MQETVKDTLKVCRDTVAERVKNPFWGYFTFSWLWINLPKVLIMGFSSGPIEERITKISSVLKFGSLDNDTLAIPFFMACGFIIVMKWISLVFKFVDFSFVSIKAYLDYQIERIDEREEQKAQQRMLAQKNKTDSLKAENEKIRLGHSRLEGEVKEFEMKIEQLKEFHLQLENNSNSLLEANNALVEKSKKLYSKIEILENEINEHPVTPSQVIRRAMGGNFHKALVSNEVAVPLFHKNHYVNQNNDEESQ